MKKKKKVDHHFEESDIGTLINDFMLELQTSSGTKFRSLQTYKNVVTIKVGSQTFIVTISDKEKLS